jgi:hypothetical protein
VKVSLKRRKNRRMERGREGVKMGSQLTNLEGSRGLKSGVDQGIFLQTKKTMMKK